MKSDGYGGNLTVAKPRNGSVDFAGTRFAIVCGRPIGLPRVESLEFKSDPAYLLAKVATMKC